MRRSSSWIAVLPSLVIPVCLGLIMYLALAYAIDQEHIGNETILRYLTGHPVSKVTVAMFFVGLASLCLIASNVFEQFIGEKKITLGDAPDDLTDTQGQLSLTQTKPGAPVGGAAGNTEIEKATTISAQATRLGKRLSELPKWLQNHYLWQRLQNGLHFAYRTDSTQGIEDELKYLADLDLEQQQQRYSLIQILIWATPMLGFLGTVLGISQALGGIDVGPDNNLQTMMDGLRGNLYIAFDTTALALTLSMLLMFGQFLVDRFETQLLLLVDQRAQGELNRHMSIQSGRSGSYREMAKIIVEANRETTEQQTEIWKNTIDSAEKAWASSLTDTNLQVQDNMSQALDENVSNLAHYLGETIEKADDAMARRWQQWQVTLSDSARQLEAQQNELREQTGLLRDLMSQQADSMASNVVDPQQQSPEPQVFEPQPSDAEVLLPQIPAPQIPASVTESPGVLNFQSYLNEVLSRSVAKGSTVDSQDRPPNARAEVVLPFRVAPPLRSNNDSPESNRLQSDDAA